MAHQVLKTLTWLFLFAQRTTASAPHASLFQAPGEKTYDYVIVGGGTAGLTVASRLAQAGNFTVGIIEAGSQFSEESGNHSVVPGYDYHGFGGPLGPFNSLSDWGFHTLPSASTANRSVLYARGKGLGGSSARNYLVYQRPSRGSMDQWAAAVSDGAWNWKNVLSYYQRSSRFHEPDGEFRGGNSTPRYDAGAFANGPIDVGYSKYPSPVSSWGLAAFREAGSLIQSLGFQSGHLIGHGWMPSSIHGKRQERSTSTEYLKADFGGRLAIHTQTFAKRIVFDGKAARSVEVETAALPYRINARREVILSCGALQTPQLLMVSGIGEKRLLSEHNIPLVHALPGVGRNLQDNPGFGLSFNVNIDTAIKIIKTPSRMLTAINQYNDDRTGFLTSSGADAVNFEKIARHAAYRLSPAAVRDLANFSSDWPEVQYWPLTTWPGESGSDNSIATFVAGLIAPLSRGSVSIRSKDMKDAPVIDAGWLTHPTDVEVAIGAVRRMQQFIDMRAIRPVLETGPEHKGQLSKIDFSLEDSDILESIQKQLSTFYHAAGTCKMGKRGDKTAVIDSKGRVFGTKNLRVVDLSGVPFLPPGQPQATVYMLAERIADFILEDG